MRVARRLALAALALVCPLVASAQTPPPPPLYGPAITLELAKRVAAGAEAEAKKNGFMMAIVVVDTAGLLTYFERIDSTQVASIDIAMAKARSANDFKRPTKAFEDAVVGGRNAVLALPHALPVEGGIPLMLDGKVIGAIGVSGGTSAQDGQVAAAGAAALK
jgi:glc operon protein GlcG